MKAAERGFNRFLLRLFIRDEGMFPVCGAAFSIYLPFHDAPMARIEATSHLDSGECEIVNFYVCDPLAHEGCGRILLEYIERYMVLNGLKVIKATPIVMVDDDFPKLTQEELIEVYRHLGFKKDKNYMIKSI